MPAKKVFVSHANKDIDLVKAFVELLEGGIGVPADEIFCSSLKGQGIKPGANFKDSIREYLGDATCVVALISPNFYGSAFCMCELGGVWLQAKNFIPILVPPLTFSDLKAVLEGLISLKLNVAADLDELRDEIHTRTGIKLHSTPRWNERRDGFLKNLPEILKALPNDASVPRATHTKVIQELDDYKSELGKSQAEVQKLKELNDALQKAKDPAAVTSVLRKHSTSIETFERLVSAAKKAVEPLTFPVPETLYYRARGEDYTPKDRDEWDDVRRHMEYGELELTADDRAVNVDVTHSKVKKAVKALDDLQKWLDSPPDEDFFQWYEKEYNEESPSMSLRQFWDRHLW